MKRTLVQPGGVLDSILRLWWLILLVTLLAVGAAAAFSLTQDPVIPSRAQVALSDVRNQAVDGIGPVVRANTRVDDEALRILSDDVVEAAAESLGITPASLRQTVTARPAEEAAALVVDGRMATAAASAERANALVAAYEANVRQSKSDRAAELIGALDQLIADETTRLVDIDNRLAQIDAELEAEARASVTNESSVPGVLRNLQASSPDRSALATEANSTRSQIRTWERRQTAITTDVEVFDGGIDFIRQARGASGPAEPNLVRNVGLAAALGLVVGLAMAWSLNGSAVERAREQEVEYERERERLAVNRQRDLAAQQERERMAMQQAQAQAHQQAQAHPQAQVAHQGGHPQAQQQEPFQGQNLGPTPGPTRLSR